jgi:hypothetical protein
LKRKVLISFDDDETMVASSSRRVSARLSARSTMPTASSLLGIEKRGPQPRKSKETQT